NNLLRREAIVELGDWPRWFIALAAAAVETLAAFTLTPFAVAFSFLVLCLVSAAATAIAFQNLIALPIVEAVVAGFAAIVGTTVFRLFVTDRDKRLLRRNFEFYLAPAVIEKMVGSDHPPQLGG